MPDDEWDLVARFMVGLATEVDRDLSKLHRTDRVAEQACIGNDSIASIVAECEQRGFLKVSTGFVGSVHKLVFLTLRGRDFVDEIMGDSRTSFSQRMRSDAVMPQDWRTVQEHWDTGINRLRSGDLAGALASSRTMLESVAKHILHEHDEEIGRKESTRALVKRAAQALGLPASSTDEKFPVLGQSLAGVVTGIEEMRDRLSDAHGKDPDSPSLAEREVVLALNAASSVALYLLSARDDLT